MKPIWPSLALWMRILASKVLESNCVVLYIIKLISKITNITVFIGGGYVSLMIEQISISV